MKKFTSSFLLFIIALISFGQSGTKESMAIKKADSLFEAGEYKQCTRLYLLADSILKSSRNSYSYYCTYQLAESYLQQGDLDKAEKFAKIILSNSSNKQENETVEALLIIGQTFISKGNIDEAETNFNKAFSLIKNNQNSLSKSKCFDQLGILNWLKGNQEKALQYLKQSLEMRKELMSENNLAIAASYNNLGLIHSTTDPLIALENYEKALSIYKSIYSLQHPKIGIALNNIGIIQRQLGETKESIVTFEKSLAIWTKLFGKEHSTVAFIYANIGESYAYNNDYSLALENLTKALTIYKQIYGRKHPEIASTYNSIGNINLHQREYKNALKNFQEALCANTMDFNERDFYSNPTIKNYYNPDLLLVTLLLKAKTFSSLHHEKTLKIKDLEYSLTTLSSCDSLIVKLRQSRTSVKDKIELGKQGSLVYENAIINAIELSTITLRKKYYEELAFYFSEKNKGAVLQEAIADANAKSFAGIPNSLLTKEKELKSAITVLEQKIVQGLSKEDEKSYHKNLFDLNLQYDNHIKEIENSFPEYYNLKFNTNTIPISSIQKSLKDDELLISYFVAEDHKRLVVFSISNNDFEIINNPLPENLNKELAAYKNSIKLMAEERFKTSAFNLYKFLLPKISSKINVLIIIPEGKLGSVPFEALLTEKISNIVSYQNLPYLIKNYTISYNYSTALFYNTRVSRNSVKNHNGILLCAPVNFNLSQELNSLPGTAKEVEKIDEIFKIKNLPSKSLLLDKANEGQIKSECQNYRYLHFATHGIVNEDQPELSQLFLNPSQNNNEDGNLYSSEIYNLKMNADLAVLSACETGLGKVKKGEGIIGLSRAFLYAGSKNLIVSLWTVSDASTSELMVNFYDSLLNNHSRDFSKALRDGKLSLINNGIFAHPYYWAPFILIGR